MKISKEQSTKKKIYKHSPSESSIQTRFIRNLKKAYPNAFICKLSDKWVSGLPDVMMIDDGKAFFYEIKTKSGRVTRIQSECHTALQNAGAIVEVVRG